MTSFKSLLRGAPLPGLALGPASARAGPACRYESSHCYPRWMCSAWAG